MIIGGSHLIFMPEIIACKVIVKAKSVPALGDIRVFGVIMVSQLCRVHVPFPDIGGFVSVFTKHIRKGVMVGIHTDFVNHHSRTGGILSCKEGCSVGGAHRMPGHRLA